MTQKLGNTNSPLLRQFTLRGLNGYKTVSLHCNGRAKIVVGDNGSSKTTLLNALYAVLAGKQALLFAINFESLELEWSSGARKSATKIELFGYLDPELLAKKAEEMEVFSDSGASSAEVVELLSHFLMGDEDAMQNCNAYRALYTETPWDKDDIEGFCERATAGMTASGQFAAFHAFAKNELGDATVLYLPTYRRIEADLPEFRNRPRTSSRRLKTAKEGWDSDRLIYFGLEDVEAKLSSITTAIRRETLTAYARISGKTLEDLLASADLAEAIQPQEPLDFDNIKLVLSRIGKQSTSTESRLKELINSDQIDQPRYLQLRKFLSQLLDIYAGRREDEEAIENFAILINEYLSTGGAPEKLLSFDKQRVELKVINQINGKPLLLGFLSSGEKQIVSIFARLQLDPEKRFLILIDEPELSLSMEWQERFLPDILRSPVCAQLIAITHSPFIFKNELSSCAGSLNISLVKPSEQVEIATHGR